MCFEFPAFLVDVGQFLFEFLLLKMVRSALFLDQCFDLVPQQPEPGVAVHIALSVLQLACPHGGIDFFLSQAILLTGRLVTQRGSRL